jgi:hypothetical protein
MTLDMTVHNFFDSLDIYLEKTVSKYSRNEAESSTVLQFVPNQYKPISFSPLISHWLPKLVTFSTPMTDPLLDTRYFEVHVACAKVAYYSGAGASASNLSRDMKESLYLASDGSSYEVLKYAIGNAILAF